MVVVDASGSGVQSLWRTGRGTAGVFGVFETANHPTFCDYSATRQHKRLLHGVLGVGSSGTSYHIHCRTEMF